MVILSAESKMQEKEVMENKMGNFAEAIGIIIGILVIVGVVYLSTQNYEAQKEVCVSQGHELLKIDYPVVDCFTDDQTIQQYIVEDHYTWPDEFEYTFEAVRK